MRRIGYLNIGLAAAALLASPAIAIEPEHDHTPAPATIRTRHKPTGSKPVSGGGDRQRIRLVTRDVRAWIKRVHAEDGEVGRLDVCAYLQKQWPDISQPVWEGIVSQF